MGEGGRDDLPEVGEAPGVAVFGSVRLKLPIFATRQRASESSENDA